MLVISKLSRLRRSKVVSKAIFFQKNIQYYQNDNVISSEK